MSLTSVGDATVVVALPRHGKQVLDDRRRANRLVIDRLERRPVFGRPWLLQQQLREAHDRGQRIVQLVRDAGERRAQAGHSLTASQQLVVSLALRNVFDDSVIERERRRVESTMARTDSFTAIALPSRRFQRLSIHPDTSALGGR